MKIVFIRHGEPDYSGVTRKKFIGHGRDLAHLTDTGKEQALKAAENPLLDGVEIILSSPYTRALQTAAVISRYKNIGIEVELDLHEWLPDLTYTFQDGMFSEKAEELCLLNKGIRPDNSPVQYEEFSSVFIRAKTCLEKYLQYKKIAVIAHGFLIRQFAYRKNIPYCDVYEIEFDRDFKRCVWIENNNQEEN